MSSENERAVRIVDLLDEALAALRLGKPVDPALWRQRHADVADDLPALLETLQNLDAAADNWKATSTLSDLDTRTSGPGRPGQQDPEARPAQIGRYRILEQIGAGGMGNVYKGHDPELDRIVAVKVPRFDGSAAQQSRAAQRFLREARAAAHVRHPHVCPIYDVGEQEGKPYAVMAFIEGPSLSQLLEKSRFDVRQSVDLVRKVARALEAVHAQRIVHRDLKPGNVLLDEASEPFLTDFGLARPVADDDHLTEDGAVVGTPAYMAPEQALGESDRIGPWTDVYSLGVVLYQLLSGALPFPGKGFKVLKHGAEGAPALSAVRPEIDAGLDRIVLKALAFRAEDRYQSAREFADALDKWSAPTVGTQPTSAIQELSSGATAPRMTRRKNLVGWALATAAVLVGVTLLYPQLIIRITGRDGKVKEIQVSPDDKVELVRPGPDNKPKVEPLEAALRPAPIPAGEPLSRMALVTRPALVKGVESWSVETRAPRGAIQAVARAPKSARLATAGVDGIIRLWDEEPLRIARLLLGHNDVVNSLSWSPDGKSIASASDDKTVRVWDAQTGRQRLILQNRSAVKAVAWSPDGKRIAASEGTKIHLWEPDSGQIAAVLTSATGAVQNLAWSPDSRLLASGNNDKTVRVFDTATDSLVASLSDHSATIKAAAWTPDGKTLACCDGSNIIRLWDSESFQLLRKATSQSTAVVDLSWSPDGKSMVTCSGDNHHHTLEFWDMDSMQLKDTRSLSRTRILWNRRVVWGPASSVVSTGLTGSSGHPVVEIIDSNTGSVKTTFAGHVRAGQDFSWSKDGKTLASTNSDGNEGALWLWDVGAGRALKTLAHSQQPTKVAWSPDGRILASARHGEVNLWAQPSDKVSKLQGNYYGDWAWSPDSKSLATGSSVGTLEVWDVFSRKLIRSLKIGKERTEALSWSPDGQTLAVFESSTSRMQFWDVGSGKLIREWPTIPFTKSINDLAFSPDGKMLLASSEKGLCFFELTTGKVLLAERGPCSGVATSTEQNVLACGKYDGTIDVWDIEGRKRLGSLEGHVWGVNKVAWSPDGQYLASASDVYHAEGTIRLWEPARGRFLGHLVPLSEAMTLAVTPEGYYRASPRTERELVYVVQTDRGQETLSAEEFAKVHGWKNDPDRVRLLAK